LRVSRDEDAIQAAIDAAIALRPKGHDFQIERLSKPATERHMSVTGG
jgi:GTP 3',8-cyclase